jgi:adenosine deaminase
MFQTTMNAEYCALQEHLHFKSDEIQQLILNAVSASWLSDEEKAALNGRIEGTVNSVR